MPDQTEALPFAVVTTATQALGIASASYLVMSHFGNYKPGDIIPESDFLPGSQAFHYVAGYAIDDQMRATCVSTIARLVEKGVIVQQ